MFSEGLELDVRDVLAETQLKKYFQHLQFERIRQSRGVQLFLACGPHWKQIWSMLASNVQ